MGGMGLSGLVFGLVALVGAMGLPLSMPPLPPDPVVLRAAPEDCIFYLGWAGNAQPNAASANRTEQILASPEVRRLVSEFGTQFDSALQQVARGKPGGESVTNMTAVWSALLTHPTAIYVSKVAPSDQGLQFSGGLVCNLGADAAAITEKLNKVRELSRARAPGGTLKTTTIGGIEFETQPGPPSGPELLLGLKDSLLIFATGADEAQALVTRLQGSGPPPKWYQELQQKLLIERPAVTSYVNVEKLLQAAAPTLKDPEVMATLEALGMAQMTSVGSTNGLTATGATSKTLIATRGEPLGLLGLLVAEPLQLDDLRIVPQDAIFSVILRLNPVELIPKILELDQKLKLTVGREPPREVVGFFIDQRLNLTGDLLRSLGDRWTVTLMPAGDAMPGTAIVGTVTVDNRVTFVALHERILDALKSIEAHHHTRKVPSPLMLKEFTVERVKVYSLVSRDFGPFTPSWCITDTHFVLATQPSLIEQFLRRGAAAPTLAESKAYQNLFARGAPSIITYQDTASLLRQLCSLEQSLEAIAAARLAPLGIQAKLPALPNPATLVPHITPDVSLSSRSADGVLIERYYSVPLNVDLTTVAPIGVAALLPAIQAAREAARTMISAKQLMQIGLGMLMHWDAKRALPRQAIMGEDGKPLLSWRVAILPYVGKRGLYDQFHLNEPWDSEHNSKLIAAMPDIYGHPGSPELTAKFKTRYLVPTGDACMFRAGKVLTFNAVVDGLANTILVVLAAPEKAVVWTKPDDLVFDPKDPTAGLGVDEQGTFQSLLADGSVHRWDQSIDPEMLRRLFNPRDGQPVEIPD